MTPIKIGMIEINPRPKTVARIVTTKVNIEIVIDVAADMPCGSPMKPDIVMASGANSRPMMATIAPMAAGGNRTSIQWTPIFFTKRARIMKHSPKAMNPPCASAYDMPAVAVTAKTGEMKAKEEPR